VIFAGLLHLKGDAKTLNDQRVFQQRSKIAALEEAALVSEEG
jgi:hypothetical protein